MINLLFSDPLFFISVFGGLVLAITIHEFAHAWAADQLGDPTPRVQGRLTLDPRSHLDPVGTIAILLTRFGWGKPVQFDPYNLKEPTRDAALISLAGPVSNLVLALVIALIVNVISLGDGWLFNSLLVTLILNINLAIFNLVPVYPLDGSKILIALLPPGPAEEYSSFMQRYGTLVLILLIFPWGNSGSPIAQIVSPIVSVIYSFLV